ncbi:hypothetical protein FF011L_37770 [Roseimaritima multifibrata]|uniref:Uncharacterized protein n=1 Tax=Roseimaritima multifibrata TaxID=1930274 RepID=A0A517MJE1_9BACT|nr:hypothetical protein FF011L_37770 [Roseimaritima multifibrata]
MLGKQNATHPANFVPDSLAPPQPQFGQVIFRVVRAGDLSRIRRYHPRSPARFDFGIPLATSHLAIETAG